VIITPPEEVKAGKRGTVQRARGFGGRVVLQGHETPFEFTVPEKPERFELDQLGEVLAMFYDEDWTPKRTLRFQAWDLDAAGDSDGAEKLLREALTAPLYSQRARAWLSDTNMTARETKKAQDGEADLENRENARIHTLLARFLLDRGALDEAEKEIDAAESLLDKPDERAGGTERRILRSRLDLARGHAEAAYQRLTKSRFKWFLGAEGFAVLAVAASESGHDRQAEEAIRKAEARGVDMRALRRARGGNAS